MEATEEQIASAIARLDGRRGHGHINRSRVATQLAAVGPKAIPYLVKALQSDSVKVRAGAAQALGGIPSDQTVGLLMTALDDPEALVRRSAVSSLGKTGRRDAAVALIKIWETKTNKGMRWALFDAFRHLKEPEVEAVLLNAVNNSDFGMARSAALVLADWGHPQAPFGMLGIVLRATEDDWISTDFDADAASLLGKGNLSIVPLYLEALCSASENVRSVVVSALGDIGDPSAVPLLLRLMEDPKEMVRSEAIFALGRLRTPEALAALLPLLWNDITETEYALAAVHRVMEPEIIAACANCLLHPSRRISIPAAAALATQGPNGLAALIAGVQSPNVNMRLTATYALRESKDRLATGSLIQALQDENKYVRRNAVQALISIADPGAADALLMALDEPGLRPDAAVALGKIGERRAVPNICHLLTSVDRMERRDALRALWDMADPASYDALITACTDDDNFVQEHAAMALGWLNLPAAADHLVSMLRHDKNFGARRGAAYALGALGLERTREELTRAWWDDPDINVFRAAGIALERFGDQDLCSPENGVTWIKVG